jgi:putative transposase
VLSQHGIKIAPSTYYETVSRQPSRRDLRDAQIIDLIVAERARQKLFTNFGPRKMWLHLRGKGHDVARCTIERLYAEQGWAGALRAKKVRTTIANDNAERPGDLVDRDFTATAPNQLWVADFTYVATWSGTVYVAFIFDVFSRMIVGWRAATTMTTELVLDTLEHAVWTRRRHGVTDPNIKTQALYESAACSGVTAFRVSHGWAQVHGEFARADPPTNVQVGNRLSTSAILMRCAGDS